MSKTKDIKGVITLFIDKNNHDDYDIIFNTFSEIIGSDFAGYVSFVPNGFIDREHIERNPSKFYVTTSQMAERSLQTIRDTDCVFVILFDRQLADNKKTLHNAVTEVTATYNSFYVRYMDSELHNNYMEYCATMLAKNVDDINVWYLNDENLKYIKNK